MSRHGRPSNQGVDTESMSFLAATLAASRSASPRTSPHVTGTRSQATPSPRLGVTRHHGSHLGVPGGAGQDVLDTTSIPPTTSLVSMFEGKGDTDPVKKGRRTPSTGRPRPKPRPITPERNVSPPRKDEASSQGRKSAVAVSKTKARLPSRKSTTPATADRSSGLESSPAAAALVTTPSKRRSMGPVPNLPPSTGKSPRTFVETKATPPPRPVTAVSESSNDSFVSATSTQREPSPSPSPPPTQRPSPTRQSSASSPSPSPPPIRSKPRPIPPPSRGSSNRPASTTPALISRQNTPSSSLPLQSLSDAIVAGSLASFRHPTPMSKTPPPPLPSRTHHHHHHHHNPLSGRHSPRRQVTASGMLTTLRANTSKSDDEDARRNRDRYRTKPLQSGKHKHHEGARQRWRDEVTPRERKRYEAVWASNRGLFLTPPSTPSSSTSPDRSVEEDYVANVVVRDIWGRSRLPADELAEVWDLVDSEGRGRLSKTDFVVGMWLVDQRLRGRKIPPRVSPSVWASVKGMRIPEPDAGKGKGKNKGGKATAKAGR